MENCRAFCQVAGRTVKLNNADSTFCGNSLTTINEVQAGWDIAPMGGSGGFPVHLDLRRYHNGSKHDPNQYVAHDTQRFNIGLTTKIANNQNDTLVLTYPGTKPTSFRLRAEMNGGQLHPTAMDRFLNVTMNLDKAEILIKKSNQASFSHIVGNGKFYNKIGGTRKALQDKERIESKFLLGARYSTSIYPRDWEARFFGDWTTTGKYPYAHNNIDNRIYDDYFFSDFCTRIDKDDLFKYADSPDKVRYTDGKYNIKAKITNVREIQDSIESEIFTIDNFKPFLDSIVVSIVNKEVYQIMRKTDEGRNNVINDGYITNKSTVFPQDLDIAPQNMTLSIRSSEPMEELTYSYRKVNGNFSAWHSLTATNDDKTQWTAQQLLNVSAGDCYEIKFKGKDTSQNGLLSTVSLL